MKQLEEGQIVFGITFFSWACLSGSLQLLTGWLPDLENLEIGPGGLEKQVFFSGKP